MDIVAKTIFGLEKILAAEIEAQGGENIELLNRAVSFTGDIGVMYKVNLWSRTALRVIVPIYSFTAHNETVFYKRLRRFQWTDLFGIDDTFAINSTVNSDYFTHSKYVALKMKDAILDQFRERNNGIRPSIDTTNPDFAFDLHCVGKQFTIAMDSSGTSLHRRGYRQSQRLAPLNEALAAGMILLSGWTPDKVLYDPMCGSGTLLTEALMIAQQIAPALNRDHFGFMNWKDYDADLWQKIKEDAKALRKNNNINIIGSDESNGQIKETQELIDSLGFSNKIKLFHQDFFTSKSPSDNGIIITNPPYDMRIQSDNIIEFYKSIGDTLKKEYKDWDVWILSGNKDALKRLGLRTSKKLTLFNGPIECKFHKYEMYHGSKKPTVTTNLPKTIID